MENYSDIRLESVEPLSPHNEASYELGKDLIKQTLASIGDFCKFMITLSTSAIAAYLALLSFIFPKEKFEFLSIENKMFMLITPVFYFFSMIIFVYGYFPRSSDMYSLNIIEEIESAFSSSIKDKMMYVLYGLIFFLLGCFFAVASIFQIVQTGGK